MEQPKETSIAKNEAEIIQQQPTQQAFPQSEQQPALHIEPQHVLQVELPPAAPANELLKGISATDITQARAEVEKHVLPHWSIIAKRSRFVRQRVLKVLTAMNAPLELQLIPVLESAYNPYALSPAGAMGLWQLMPRTARGLGVYNSKGHDGRRNIEQSTKGAVQYLLKMHHRFGNWPLAFAAYNYGPNALAKRLRKQPWEPEDGLNKLPAPAVTRTYVRHIIGLSALLHDQHIIFPEPVRTRSVKLPAPVDLKQLASLAGMEKNHLFLFNPGLNQGQYLTRHVSIHVPEEAVDMMLSRQKETGPRYVNTVIRSGDTLWKLARKHQTSIRHLQRLNPNMGKYLSIGKLIKVPANQLARAKASANPMLSQGRRILYRVRSGDSLWILARRFGTTPKAIASSNRLTLKSLIRPGDKLWILAHIRPG